MRAQAAQLPGDFITADDVLELRTRGARRCRTRAERAAGPLHG